MPFCHLYFEIIFAIGKSFTLTSLFVSSCYSLQPTLHVLNIVWGTQTQLDIYSGNTKNVAERQKTYR